MTSAGPCPNRDDLQQLVFGQLPPEEAEPLALHLTECHRCLQIVRTLPQSDPLVEVVRASSAVAATVDEGLIDRLCRLRAEPSWADDAEELPLIPGYEIVARLGRGGMGVVYKAWQVRLRRLVALKMLRAGPEASPEALARFQAEAEVLARLRHPHIVQVYEVGEHDGRPYYVMEFVDGGSLAQQLHGTPLPDATAAAFVETLARAVHAAHVQGIIHRDLKPANILLQNVSTKGTKEHAEAKAEDGDLGGASSPSWIQAILKISDFGLAKQLGALSGQTQSGAILGTPSYMAPEQTAGSTATIGPGADVYALGAILYELLTGRPPFQAATVWGTLEQVRTQDPVPPRRLQLRLARDLQTICLKCLAKEPPRRYASALELAEDLQHFLAGEPIRARPAGHLERLLKWTWRRPLAAALIGVSGLAVAAQGGSVAVHNSRLRAQVERAEAGEAEARKQQQRADANYRAARMALTGILDRLKQKGAADVPGLKELQRLQLEDALAFYQGILQELDAPGPAVRLDVALAYQQTGRIQVLLGRPGPAEENLREAVALLRTLVTEYPETLAYQDHLAACYSDLGSVYTERGYYSDRHRLEQAEQCQRQALQGSEALARAQPESAERQRALAKSYHNLGAVYQLLAGQSHDAARFAQAEAQYQQALERTAQLRQEHPEVLEYRVALAETSISLALLYHQTKRPDRAEAAYQQAESLLEPIVRERPRESEMAVSLGKMYGNWANFLNDTGRLEAALEKYQQTIRLMAVVLHQEPYHGPARRTLLNAHGGRAYLHHGLKRYAEAVKDWERVVELADEVDRARYRGSLAVALAHAGEHARASAEAQALAADATLAGDTLYNAACAGALAAQAVRQDAKLTAAERDHLAERYAVQAILLLAKLHAADYFTDPARNGYLQSDTDLNALRGRPEFQKLLPEKDKAREQR